QGSSGGLDMRRTKRIIVRLATLIVLLCSIVALGCDESPKRVATGSKQTQLGTNALTHPDPKKRITACRDLLHSCRSQRGASWPYQATPEVVAALVDALGDSNDEVRWEAGTCLLNMR